jgi:hypothetical protein
MDKSTRNAIGSASQNLRKLLEQEYLEQLEGTFDVGRDGYIAEAPGAHLSPAERVTRSKIVGAIRYHRASRLPDAEAVERFVRDAAFTTLNRFVALKMLEARELVQQCVNAGPESAGYREFVGLAPGGGNGRPTALKAATALCRASLCCAPTRTCRSWISVSMAGLIRAAASASSSEAKNFRTASSAALCGGAEFPGATTRPRTSASALIQELKSSWSAHSSVSRATLAALRSTNR